jgi:predicted permease
MLMALAFAVLLVACANVAGLLASRAPVRAREIALRLAIGGSEFRLFRQLVTESFLIATAGGVLGLALAEGIIRSFRQFQIPSDVGVRLTFELDRRTLVAGFLIALASALLSSLAPAWRASRSRDLTAPLRNTTAPASSRARLWGRHGLVAVQIGLTLVVLTVAVSFYRAFETEYSRGPGFRTDHILLMNLDPTLARYNQQQTDAFFRLLEQQAEALPGVTSVGLTSFVPLSQEASDQAVVVPEGFEAPEGRDGLAISAARIDEGYLDAIGVRVLRGRGFSSSDTADAPRVAIVNSGMAARYWPDQDPIGKRIRLVTGDGAWLEIVGVSADHKFRLFTPASTDFLYLPRSQNPIGRATILLATEGESAALAAPLREAVLAIDPNVPIRAVRTMEDFYHASAKNLNTVVVRTVAGMGSMGLALAMVGLYGLMAYAISRRTREIGIRMAMGALPASVLRMVLRQGYLPTICGVVLGAAASAASGRLLDAAFPNTSADLVTYLLVVPALIAIVMMAAYLPARRATRIDPLRALRQD